MKGARPHHPSEIHTIGLSFLPQPFIPLPHPSHEIYIPVVGGVRGHIRANIVLQSGKGSNYHCEISGFDGALAV